MKKLFILFLFLTGCSTYVSTRDCDITCRREGARLDSTHGKMCNCELREKPEKPLISPKI